MFGYGVYMQPTTATAINEAIYVTVDFSFPVISVLSFTWNKRTYEVESTNMFHIEKDHDRTLYHFAVSCSANCYELVYNPLTLEWRLETLISI